MCKWCVSEMVKMSSWNHTLIMFLVMFTRCLPSRHLWALRRRRRRRRRRAEDMTHISTLSASLTFPTWWWWWWWYNTVSRSCVVKKSSEMQISHCSLWCKWHDLHCEAVKNQAKMGPLLLMFNEHWDSGGFLCGVGVFQGPCCCWDWPHRVIMLTSGLRGQLLRFLVPQFKRCYKRQTYSKMSLFSKVLQPIMSYNLIKCSSSCIENVSEDFCSFELFIGIRNWWIALKTCTFKWRPAFQ